MNHRTDLLGEVVAALEERKGDLPRVAKETGVPYDTVLRIKNRENDPGYSKVKALHDYLCAGLRSTDADTPAEGVRDAA